MPADCIAGKGRELKHSIVREHNHVNTFAASDGTMRVFFYQLIDRASIREIGGDD